MKERVPQNKNHFRLALTMKREMSSVDELWVDIEPVLDLNIEALFLDLS